MRLGLANNVHSIGSGEAQKEMIPEIIDSRNVLQSFC